MELDPDYADRSTVVNIELREMVADLVEINFRELQQLQRAADSYRLRKGLRVKLVGHEVYGLGAAVQSLEDGIRWFDTGGNYWIWIGAMRYEGEEPGLIAAQYIREARELQQRLRAIGEGGQ